MKLLIAVASIMLVALAGCYSNYPESLSPYGPVQSMPSQNGGGPGPGNVPTNPSSEGGS